MPDFTALILDDDREHTAMVEDHLKSEGFRFLHGAPDLPAPEIVKREKVEICLVGDRARGCDGLEVVRELRHQSPAGIVMLGQSADEIDTVLALEMGADDYMVKPVRLRELCARIRTVLRRTIITPPDSNGARPLPEQFLRRIDDLEICGVQRLVKVNGNVVDLTPSEYDVLMVLSAKTNTVLSRDRIVAAMKGDGHAINDRAVDGIVSRLRRKLFEEPKKGETRIRTVHGRGYMLVEG